MDTYFTFDFIISKLTFHTNQLKVNSWKVIIYSFDYEFKNISNISKKMTDK